MSRPSTFRRRIARLAAALATLALSAPASARLVPRRLRSSPRHRALVKASSSVLMVRVVGQLSASWVRIDGVRQRLGRRRVRLLRKLHGVRPPRRLVIYDAPAKWGRYRATRLPKSGRVIAFVRHVGGRWHLSRRGAYEPAKNRRRVMHAIRVQRIRAALARITKRKAGILGVLRGRGKAGAFGGSLSRAIGRSRHRRRYRRWRYLVLRDVEVVHRDGAKSVRAKILDEVKRRGRRCSLRLDKACVVKLRLSVAPTYGCVIEHEPSKRDGCALSTHNKRCLDKALRDIDAGSARATFGVTLRYGKRK
jgi:hypothetical protein